MKIFSCSVYFHKCSVGEDNVYRKRKFRSILAGHNFHLIEG